MKYALKSTSINHKFKFSYRKISLIWKCQEIKLNHVSQEEQKRGLVTQESFNFTPSIHARKSW